MGKAAAATRQLDDMDLVILVHDEDPRLLELSFAALSEAMGPDWLGRVVLFENAPSKATSAAAEDLLRPSFPVASPTVIRSRRNHGFGGAINLAIAEAGGRYVGVFNPDGAVSPDAAVTLVQALEREPAALMAAARILPFCSAPEPADPPREAEWLPGGATVYRRQAFEEIGGFDPLYFMYSGDVELSRRARGSGWLLLEVPAAVFRHDHAGWGRWQRLRRLRRWTTSATTLSYQYAPSRRQVLRALARKRARWFLAMARERRWTQLAGALLGTAVWPAKLPRVERRRRDPWNRGALEAWRARRRPSRS